MHEPARILVVDDEQVVRSSCERTLSPEGHQIHEAASGMEAIERLNASDYDLALLDLRIPAPCGLTVLRFIRDAHPRTGVIVFTGYPTIENAKESIRLGAFDFIHKPLDPQTIRSAVSRALARMRPCSDEVKSWLPRTTRAS